MPAIQGSGGFDARSVPRLGQKIYFDSLSDAIAKNKVMVVDKFSSHPHILQNGTGAVPVSVNTLPTAVQDNVNTMFIPDAFGCQYAELSQTTAQTLLPLRHATKGLEIGGDKVDNESLEIVFGGNHANNPLAMFTGTNAAAQNADEGIILDATFEITDVSGLDQFGIFLRNQEAYAVPASFLTTGDPLYQNIALFGFAATVATPNIIRSSTDIANSGSSLVSSTGFSVPDNGIVRLMMEMRGRKVFYWINNILAGNRIAVDGIGGAIAAQFAQVPASYTFAFNMTLIPGIFVRQDTTAPTAVYLRKFRTGPRSAFGLNPDGRVGDGVVR
jgi:hypothetical protein